MNYLERMYVDEEWLARPDIYNIALGGNQTSLTESIRKKISAANLGRKHTVEWNEKISKKNAGSSNHFYGRTHTRESRQKISLAAKNRDYTCQQISVNIFNTDGECIDTLPSC